MNDYVQKPNTGKLMPSKEKKHEKSPDFWGSIYVDKDLLIELIKNSTDLVEIKLDSWKNVSAAGNHYLSIKINTFKPQEKDPWNK